jgi:hypothetical protein
LKLAAFAAVLLVAAPAGAQVRWDVGALGSFQQRFVGSTVAEGGALTIDGHVAVFPLVRVGAWATGEVSKRLDDSPVREIFGGGLQLRVTSPWPRGAWRVWLATGFGYDGLVSDAGGGGFFEVPAILGASYRFRRPWVFLMELAARPSFGFWGSYYAPGSTDAIAVALSFGVGIFQ